jgi:hypothetical protein
MSFIYKDSSRIIISSIFAIHLENKLFQAFDASAGIDSANVGANTASDNEIDRDFCIFQCLNGACMGPTARGLATQN